ncbi:cytochrome P450 4C1-like [Anoplophora glabripennis]|uniref:cytochrome P450 4C1-like n=1 Tax=Anoplophora glabripennis TaxID=217634 RepID=UPI0008756B8E|nr:cytochrome P450 4C1-like [Anoplophora glabripennis]
MVWVVENLTLVLVLSVPALWYLSYLWKRRKLYIYSWNIPGPFALPFIGAAYKFIGSPEYILEKLIKLVERYPSPMSIWLGPRLFFCLTDPHHAEKILTSQKCLGKDHFYKFMIYNIGTGLLTAPVPKWKKHRKLIMPSFHQKILDSFVDIFTEQATVFTDILRAYAGRKNIDISKPVSAMMLDIICETAMGLKMNTQREGNVFATHLDQMMLIATIRVFAVWHHLDWTWRLYPLSRKLDKHLAGIHEVTSKIIRKKLEVFEKQKENRRDSLVAELDEGGKKRRVFLDLILENSEFTEEEIREEVNIFLGAGTDTSSTTLCFLLEMLGLYPEIQQKVYEEVIDVLGEERSVEASDLPRFMYLERVIKETLRLFPVGAFVVRSIGEDINLGTCTLPKGSSALISSLNIHRDPKYWPEPLKFDPDRFLPEEIAKRHPCCYIPFSYGPRNCIGNRYAMMSLKTIAATTVRKYRMFTGYKSVEDIEMMVKVIVKPTKGYKVYLEQR